MRVLQSLIIAMLIMPAVEAQVIHQVLYDPLTESGGEAIELYNPGSTPVDISNWVLQTETSLTDATVPDDTLLQSGGYYLIADVGWEETKEHSWPSAHHEEPITLTNTNAGVALFNGTHIVDAVGWGEPNEIDAGLFEGTPHEGAEEGQALLRVFDTNNNNNDFVAQLPTFASSASPTSIPVTINVGGSIPHIRLLSLLRDDDSSEGIQIRPMPGGTTILPLTASLTHDSGLETIDLIELQFNNETQKITTIVASNSTDGDIAANVSIPYTLPPGTYEISVHVQDANNLSTELRTFFEIQGVVALQTPDSLSIDVETGSQSDIIAELTNIGNVPLNLELSSTDFIQSTNTIPAHALHYAVDDYEGVLSTIPHIIPTNLLSSENLDLHLTLDLPPGTLPGTYEGSLSISATS